MDKLTQPSVAAFPMTVTRRHKYIVGPKAICFVFALGGFAGLLWPASAAQEDTPDPRPVEERSLLGDATALGELGALAVKQNEAFNKNDPTAVAELFTDDAVLVAPDGIFSGRQAIEKRYQETFQNWPFTLFSDPRESQLKAIDNAVWSVGEWWSTLQSRTGPVFVTGYWSAIYVLQGDAWKIRMLTLSERTRPTLLARTD